MRNEPRTHITIKPIRLLALLALLATPATAQTTLSGNTYDGNGGPLLTGQVYHTSGFSVPSGQTLTIQPGAMLKVDGATINVFGNLSAVGTAVDPIRVTSIADDSVGGDTNADGASTGAPGDWNGLSLRASSTTTFEHVVFEYGGGALAPITSNTGAWSATNCTFSASQEEAIDLSQVGSSPAITSCSFVDNGTYPIEGANLNDIGGMVDNTASGSGTADYVPVRSGSMYADVTIGPANLIGGVLVMGAPVSTFRFITLEAGVVVKWLDGVSVNNRHFVTSNYIFTRGTKENPVVFTSFADDEHGGDTNGDGPSAGAPGDWAGLRGENGGALDMEHTLLRFGGGHPSWAPVSTINTGGAVLQLSHVTIQEAQDEAMSLGSFTQVNEVTNCIFSDYGTYPVDGLSFAQLEHFQGSSASSSRPGSIDAFRVTHAFVSTPVTITKLNYPGQALILSTAHHVNPGASLTLEKGVILKAEGFSGINAAGLGEINLNGTAFEPVVLTTLEDDTFGGDTNQDGSATMPVPQSTSGFRWNVDGNGNARGSVEHALSRYASYGFFNQSPEVSLRSIRADYANFNGIRADALSGPGMNWVAFGCTTGITMQMGSAIDLYHATSVNNSADGISSNSGSTGLIVNSITWGNGNNFALSGTHSITYSDGTSAGTGNFNLDPQFVDQAGGDLRLQSGSPCIDMADYATAVAVVKDHDEFSRLLDPTHGGILLPDMGAYEHSAWRMNVRGEPHIGSTMILEVNGSAAGVSFFQLGLMPSNLLQDPLGFRMIGMSGPNVLNLGVVNVNTPHLVRIPRMLGLVGQEFGIQTLTLSSTSPALGEWTNLYRSCFLPRRRGKNLLLAPPGDLPHVFKQLGRFPFE